MDASMLTTPPGAFTDRQRIAWVVYGSLHQISGGYIYDRLVVEQLRELGDTVTCLSLAPGADARPLLARADYDVVVGDELCFRELGPLFRAAPAGLWRVLLIHHLSAWEHPPGNARSELLALEKAAIDAADACVATSSVTADRLHRDGLARNLRVAEPGADRLPRPRSVTREPHDARVRLLFIGNVLPRKRVLELIQAVAGLRSAQLELVLVGTEVDAHYAAEVRAAIREGGIARRVHWLGSLDALGLVEQLALADALVLPSALEGYGMVLSEALWAAVPIIAARVGAAEQLVGQTGAGLLFDPHDRAGLASALANFVEDAALRSRLRHSACSKRDALPRWRDTALTLRAALKSR
jgi:glycosyltransferase involved in cell wall biosynthesis